MLRCVCTRVHPKARSFHVELELGEGFGACGRCLHFRRAGYTLGPSPSRVLFLFSLSLIFIILQGSNPSHHWKTRAGDESETILLTDNGATPPKCHGMVFRKSGSPAEIGCC